MSKICYIPDGAVVAALGDSLSEMGFWEYDINGYWASVGCHTRLYNCGIGGNRVSMAPYYLQDEVLWLEPDYVLVLFGANDVQPGFYTPEHKALFAHEDPTVFKTRYREKYEKNLRITVEFLR